LYQATDVGTLASVNPTRRSAQIRKQSGMATVAIVNAVSASRAEPTPPPGYRLRIVRDQAEFIEASISVRCLVIGSRSRPWSCCCSRDIRSTIIAAISIPTSIIATFGLVRYMDFTLNMLTMLALTLAVGIVIDDAIVVGTSTGS
jgi:HAE1 family hydrophobic/amphiphilic exporter-1